MSKSLWELFYQACGANDWNIFVWGTWLALFIPLIVYNVLFGVLDVYGLPSWLRKYKIQPEKNVPMSTSKYLQTMYIALFNATVVTILTFAVTSPFVFWRGIKCDPDNLPPLNQIIYETLACILVIEASFYYLHRLLHHPWLFKTIHKIHHEWKAPCVMAQFYCHPIEHSAVNLGSAMIGPWLLGSHLSVWWVFMNLAVLSSVLAHSGYHFPFLPSPESHDFHHSWGIQNFGSLGLMDWFHGTNKHFKESESYQKHFILLSLTPVNEKIKIK